MAQASPGPILDAPVMEGTGSGHSETSPLSTAAIISYLLIGVFVLVVLLLFGLIYNGKTIGEAMIGVIGGIIAAVTTALGAVYGFWLASSAGSRQNSAALRQIAGAGPPPPADPNVTGQTQGKDP